MELYTVLLLLPLLAVAARLLFNLKSRKTKLIEQLPGPPAYPIIGNLLDILVPREQFVQMLMNRRNKYGEILRTWLGPIPAVHLSSPSHIETILSSNKHITKGELYKFLYPWLGTGLLTSTGQKWHTHRKLITPTFHFKILDSFVEVFREQSEVLVHKLEGKADTGEEFDVYPYITLCALDIICETAMGTKVNAQEESQSPYVSAIYRVATLTMERSFKLWLHPDAIFYRTKYGKEYKQLLEVLHGFTERVIQERLQQRMEREKGESLVEDDLGTKRRQAFLDLLLDASGDEPGHAKLTDLELREEVDTFMFEGHDTTTAGICWTLFLLGHHQNIQDEVFSELQDIFQDDPARAVKMGDLGQMKLLERVIKESLRIYPSVPFVSRKLEEDARFGDYVIPSGTTIGVHIMLLHRDPSIYPEPDKFDPDRFLPENIQQRHPYAYVPFSAGARNCIGQKFALLEEKTVLATLIRHYRFQSTVRREDVGLISELVLRPGGGIRLKITKRT